MSINWKWMLLVQLVLGSVQCQRMKKTKCLNPPRTAKKVETHIKDCQDEVKNKLVKEAFGLIREHMKIEGLSMNEYYSSPSISQNDDTSHLEFHDHSFGAGKESATESHASGRWGKRRRSMELYHPTLVPYEDKRLAGCLLHCVYAKNNAIDHNGWPTLDGLVDFYSEGVNEHGFFMATLRAVNLCLKATTHKYHVNINKLPEKGESCDLAFDVFDCISDQITGYCLDHYRQ